MAATNGVSPAEDALKEALKALRTEHPTLGINKLHASLLAAHPEWSVSEKRTRKVLQTEGLVISAGPSEPTGFKYPSSKVMEGLDVGKWTNKVEVRVFDRKKGKGLVAKEKIAEGETIWKEDPFILAPECRLCLSRSARTHPLLCPAHNPASGPLLLFAKRNEWMALHALTQCTARILLDAQADEATLKSDWEVVKSLAQLGMEERHAQVSTGEPDRATWKKAFQLYEQSFREPAQESEKKKLAKILKKPVPQEVVDELFNYDAFLRNLGRMSLNLEAHGGLYVLHSHINHACDPNTSIRHFDQRTALARITVVAKKDIELGEELFITYVNPEMRRSDRQRQLDEWGFGACRCARCNTDTEEEAKLAKEGKLPVETPIAGADGDLVNELKAGLGVF
ncbi:hypothetical protein EUX98_g864 [Antrodiella citrinella]|uniref:Histone-lysine N-methyltransferase SET5 n=1 Tax=Antrodiella citrinella TaxID=2447956 RepID=A0A4S4N324_9APHY|nr:hypothetical protein EUX98_g864 [Antrodiella citrinella]